ATTSPAPTWWRPTTSCAGPPIASASSPCWRPGGPTGRKAPSCGGCSPAGHEVRGSWPGGRKAPPMTLDLTGIHNVGEFYSHHYLDAVLGNDLKDILKSWSQAEQESGRPAPNKQLSRLADAYFK